MVRLAVITKSYAPDFELCVELNRSVLACTPDTVTHSIIVPRPDLQLFGRLAGARTRIRCDGDVLPKSFVRAPLTNFTINLARPFPPVRGWIQQQVVKLAAVAEAGEDVVLTVDSDVEFIRPFDGGTFMQNGAVRFFSKPNEVDARLPRHISWHRVAHDLLGLSQTEPPYPDYIASSIAWSPPLVRQMLARVERVTGRPWATAIASRLEFSECILYGVFIERIADAHAKSFAFDDPLCVSYWEHKPLEKDAIPAFVQRTRATDIAGMISSKAHTDREIRREAFRAIRAHQADNGTSHMAR